MKAQVQWLLTVQSVMTMAYLGLVFLFRLGDWFSALIGCLASLLPSLYFSIRMLRQADNNEAAAWLGYAYRSEIVKWVMGGIIFALAFTSGYPWDPLILFIGYLLVQVSAMFVPLIQKGK